MGGAEYPRDWGWFIGGTNVGYRQYCKRLGYEERDDHNFYGLHYLGTTKSDEIIHNNSTEDIAADRAESSR